MTADEIRDELDSMEAAILRAAIAEMKRQPKPTPQESDMTPLDTGYAFYFPEDGEGPDDAVPSRLKRVFDAECVAQEACEYDFQEGDGWERSGNGFAIAVICPDGSEVRFTGCHEPSVNHTVWREE